METRYNLFFIPSTYWNFAVYSFKENFKVPLVFEIRDLWPEIISDIDKSMTTKFYIKFIKYLVSIGYKYADLIISVKRGDLNYIKSRYKTNAEFDYLPNGFDIHDIIDEEYNNQILDKNNRFKIGYLGGLSDYYNLTPLINVISRNLEIDLIIVGDGNDYEKYKKLAKTPNIYFLGRLPKKYMLSIAKKCDLLYTGLKDSKYNDHGISTNKLFEYMIAKKPVLGFYNSKEDIIEKNNFGKLVSDENSLELAIKYFEGLNKKKLNSLGENGYKFLIKNNTYEILGLKLNKILKKIIN